MVIGSDNSKDISEETNNSLFRDSRLGRRNNSDFNYNGMTDLLAKQGQSFTLKINWLSCPKVNAFHSRRHINTLSQQGAHHLQMLLLRYAGSKGSGNSSA
ncbi:hypothetical protein TNCT_577021 [Trichonephila clavata]|uniref:Uncharacterized protein n=1 Tax=Trichonephila clavata TaxID=2740835 RepID=A0A8X6M5L3_TRICU|nr:hypothetical protein TNCT_577021 [Trichonephila clavata]